MTIKNSLKRKALGSLARHWIQCVLSLDTVCPFTDCSKLLSSAVRRTQILWAPKEQETGYLALHLSSIVHSFHHLKVTALPSPLHALRSGSFCVCAGSPGHTP